MSAGANTIAATRHQISSNNINDKMKKKVKLILLPGMGCCPVKESNFYGWLETKIRTDAHLRERFTLDLRDFPDPHLWYYLSDLLFSFFDYDALKLIRERMCCLHLLTFCLIYNSRHPSGCPSQMNRRTNIQLSPQLRAQCARYAEKYKVKGICVCAGYDDDLGDGQKEIRLFRLRGTPQNTSSASVRTGARSPGAD